MKRKFKANASFRALGRPTGMRRRSFLRALGSIAMLGAVLASSGDVLADAPPTIDARLAAIAQARASLTTLQGPFTQTKTIGLMATKIISTGTMAMERPSKLRWELAAPDSVVYWMLPAGLAYKGKNGHGQLPVTDKMAPQLADMKAFLGGDLGTLRARYDLRELPETTGVVTIEATPKPGTEARFKQVLLTLDPDLVRPKKVVLVEGAKDRTEIVFGELKKNAPLDPASMSGP
ncbi:hypothetical protein BH09MYX1_BH09MYX1_45560 [soil metagenome]